MENLKGFKNMQLKERTYLKLMIFILPLINFVSGIAIDLYAPSMPAIATEFNVTSQSVQNTITIFLIGWAIGCVIWGAILDLCGRRKIVLGVLVVFIITSIIAPHCYNIEQIMFIRLIQGIATAAISVGSRALVADHFTGHDFTVAIIYVSIAYGLGPVIAPVIGGYLQYHFGWRANFYTFAIFGFVMFMLVLLLVNERYKAKVVPNIKNMLFSYSVILRHFTFLAGCVIVGCAQVELLIYPTIGPFMVEKQMHYSSIIYGQSALLPGAGYLFGSIVNRSLLRVFTQKQLVRFGFILMFIAVIVQIISSLVVTLNITGLIAPIILITIANGFVIGNIISSCIKLFQNNAGVATASQIGLSMICGGLGVFLVSLVKVSLLFDVAKIFAVVIIIQFLMYKYFSRIFSKEIVPVVINIK